MGTVLCEHFSRIYKTRKYVRLDSKRKFIKRKKLRVIYMILLTEKGMSCVEMANNETI